MNEPGRGVSESFARYYLRQVAIGEGCNCAELVVRDAKPAQGGSLAKFFVRRVLAPLARLWRA